MTWTYLQQPPGRPWAVVDGDTLDSPEPAVWARFRSEARAYRAAIAECPYPSWVVQHQPHPTPTQETP